MAESTIVTQEEMAMRRRARRRLVGAVAIAMTAVLVLPMVFDPEPKPLGPDVDLRIPAKDTPFEPTPEARRETPVAAEPTPDPLTAEPTLPPPPAKPALAADTPSTGLEAETKPEANVAKPSKSEKKPGEAVNSSAKPETKIEVKPATKLVAKADEAFANRGFFLQLGAFGSEINARQLQEKAQAAGFKAMMHGANGQYRVRVGPIPEHDRALDMQAKLKAKGFSPVLLGP